MLDHTQAVAGTFASAVLILGGMASWFRWVRPRLKQWAWERQAKNDVLIGRPAERNSITGEYTPALPGVADQIKGLREDVRDLLRGRIEDHEVRLHALERAAVERIVTKAESAQMWRAVAGGEMDIDRPRPDDN